MPPSIDNVVAQEPVEDEEMATEETHNGQMNGDTPMAVDRPTKDVKMRVTLNGVPNGSPYLYRNQAADQGTKPGHYLLKLLVPPPVAGSIIGRGGAQIKELQLTYDVAVKLSQNNQLYPESNRSNSGERIVLITGPPENLAKVAEFIHSLVRNPPSNPTGADMLDSGRRMQMMKMVVTNSTAGMIIGKGGATVKSLNETYDVRIQASQKDDVVMGERVLTILGPEDGVNKTMEYIIKEKFRDDPTSTSITNLDYSSYMDANGGLGMGGMNNMGSTASLNYGSFDGGQDMSQVNLIQTLLQNQNQQQSSPNQQSNQYSGYQNAGGYGGNSGNAVNSFMSASQQNQQQNQQQQQQQQQQNNNSSNQAEVIARVLQALPNNALSNTSNLANTIMLIQALSGNNNNNSNNNMPQMNQQRISAPAPSKSSLKPFIPRPDDVKYKVEIPDSLVGRVLGRLGATITEIQNTSGCEVKFSQRGEYVPGTQNRLLYVCGQQAGCKIAQQLILSKIEGDAGDVSSSDFVFEQIPNN